MSRNKTAVTVALGAIALGTQAHAAFLSDSKATLGMRKSNWIVFDTGDIVAHIFVKQIREFYNVEGLWQEAKRIGWE